MELVNWLGQSLLQGTLLLFIAVCFTVKLLFQLVLTFLKTRNFHCIY